MTNYNTVEGYWLTLVRTVSGISSSNSSRGDWNIRNKGTAEKYVIIKPGPRVRDWQGLNTRRERCETVIQVFQRFKGYGSSMTALESTIDAIVTVADAKRFLNQSDSGLQDADIVRIGEFIEVMDGANAAGPSWIYAELIGEAIIENQITFTG